ncbi:hypothetical protein NO135_25385, partial [Clostridioides difficile]|nr:hypothetical protein [Clostridioides difficile]
PRHPQRFAEVEALVERSGLKCVRRSVWAADTAALAAGRPAVEPLPDDVTVLLGDSMGELGAYYTAADIAFIG